MSYSRMNNSFDTWPQSHSDDKIDTGKRGREDNAERGQLPDDARFVINRRMATDDALPQITLAEVQALVEAENNRTIITPLWLATYNGKVEEVRELLDEGADMNEVCYKKGEFLDSSYALATNRFKDIPNRDAIIEEFHKYRRNFQL